MLFVAGDHDEYRQYRKIQRVNISTLTPLRRHFLIRTRESLHTYARHNLHLGPWQRR